MNRSCQWIADAVGGTLCGPDVVVTAAVQTDSREVVPGSLYVARRGEAADGHDYLQQAAAAGAVAAIVEEVRADGPATQIIVDDSTVALGEFARAHLSDLRQRHPEIVVTAVTGSAGKTSTKDLLRQIFSSVAPTVAPRLSFNNEVGLPLTVLTVSEDTRFVDLEMGASGPGHIEYLTQIAPPDIAIELMVGHAHMGGFGSIEGIAKAKAELVSGLRPTGIAVLNIDDPHVEKMVSMAPGKVVTFSAAGRPDATFSALDITVDESGHPSFTLRTPGGNFEVASRMIGRHHVSNILAAISAAYCAGVSISDAVSVVGEAYAESPHRMDVRQCVVSQMRCTIIDDSYNANTDSMRAGIAALRQISKGRRSIAVIGEMLELGDDSEAMHLEVADMLMEAEVDRVITVGDAARCIVDKLSDATSAVHAANHTEALGILTEDISENCVVLIKGSNGSGVHRIADALFEEGMHR